MNINGATRVPPVAAVLRSCDMQRPAETPFCCIGLWLRFSRPLGVAANVVCRTRSFLDSETLGFQFVEETVHLDYFSLSCTVVGTDLRFMILSLLAAFGETQCILRFDDDDAVRIPPKDVARIDSLSADSEGVIDVSQRLFHSTFDTHGAGKYREAELAEICAIPHA